MDVSIHPAAGLICYNGVIRVRKGFFRVDTIQEIFQGRGMVVGIRMPSLEISPAMETSDSKFGNIPTAVGWKWVG